MGPVLRRLFVPALLLAAFSTAAAAQTTTKVLDNGPDGERLTFAVLGDGYTEAEQGQFAADVDRLVVNGVLGHDFYQANQKAFNVYRVDLVSSESGVSTPMFTKDTALRVVFNGQWNRCWLEESAETGSRILEATKAIAKVDYVLVVAHESGFGGCRRGSRLFITSGVEWPVVAHEYGHAIAGLFDEYTVSGDHVQPPVNVKNCSTLKDRSKVVWKSMILANTPVLTDDAADIDANQTVGIFTGCSTEVTGIYRPVRECRMSTNRPLFCPVCAELMRTAVFPYLPQQPAVDPAAAGAAPPAAPPSGYVSLTVRLRRKEASTVLRAVEVQGPLARLWQAAPPFFFALSKDEKPVSAQFLPSDPYQVRGFADPQQKDQGEFRAEADEATVFVSMPKAEGGGGELGLQLYSIDPAALQHSPTSFFPTIGTKAVMKRLGKGIKREMNVPAETLSLALQEGRLPDQP